MKSTIIPYLYKYKGNLIYRRAHSLDDEIIISMCILYRVDFLDFKIINKKYYAAEYSVEDVTKIIISIVDNMDKIFR